MQRITHTTSSRMMLANIQSVGRKLTEVQGRIASGKEMQRPSDDPARVLTALDYRAQIRRADQLSRNATDARTWLSTADQTLSNAVDRVSHIRTLSVGALNASSDANARKAYAEEIRAVRDELVQLANTTYMDRPIFGGTAAVSAAYSSSGQYLGDAGAINRPIAPSVSIQVNRVGPAVFGTEDVATPEDGNLFQMLGWLADRVQAGDTTAISIGLTKIDAATDVIETAQVELGARALQVDNVVIRAEDSGLQMKMALSDIEDVDIAEATIELKSQELAYQAALQVTAKIIQPSLLDFLR